VSPLIAVVLLIVFTVAVSTMIMSWMNTYTKDTTTSASSNTDTVISCSKQTVDIPTSTGVSTDESGGYLNVTINVENNGQANTTVKKVIAFDSSSTSCAISATEATLSVGDFQAFGPVNCSAVSGWSGGVCRARVTTTCGGIYDEWTNSSC
ncbi:MAG: hypothetical protein KAT91_03325, partial [Candidatus Aenigmarchaeota archaeon]|nr:hypothetical protein [Candidatus Aenigmarchaeota archaeon]